MKIGPTRWCKTETDLAFAEYGDGSLALLALDPQTGQPALKLTVNMADTAAPKVLHPIVWLKTWAENEGVAEALVEAGIVTLNGFAFEVNQFGSLAVMATLTPATLLALIAEGGDG